MEQPKSTIKSRMSDIHVGGLPLWLYLLALVLLAAALWMDCLPRNIVGAFFLLMILGDGLNYLGNTIPVVKTYLGGSVICIFGGAILAAAGVFHQSAMETMDAFVNDEGFLVLYISALITGSLFSIDRNLLLQGAVRILPVSLTALLVGFLVCYVTGSNWLGLLCGALAGIAVNMVYAFSTITLCANHTVYGMAINIFAPALASFIYRVYFGTGSDLKQIVTMSSVAIPGLKDIPVIGALLFDQSPMVYLTLLFVAFTAVFFARTRAGLSYKSVGEHPQAAATLGIHVIGIKYLSCVICGALAGIGGAYLTTCYSSTYTDGIVAGRGFIALAAVIFGRWNAGGILLACLFFGFCDALQIRLQVSGIAIPYQFFQMIPYLATVLVLSLIGTKQAGPRANGQPYRREQR